MAHIPPPPGPKGFIASASTQAKLKVGDIYRTYIWNYPWTDAWADAYPGDNLWHESYARIKVDGILVKILPWQAPPLSFAGDRAVACDWAFTEMLTGPFSAAPWYTKLWVASHWLIPPASKTPSATTTCQCSIQTIWNKGCQCGKS